jgi:hypothetical protein
MSFFDAEEFHAVVPAKGSPCGISAMRRKPSGEFKFKQISLDNKDKINHSISN